MTPNRRAAGRAAVVTCYLRYVIEPSKIEEFEHYARLWIPLVERFGGTHHGYFLPSECYFPNGFGPLVERCREHDLKFGVHLMRGIPRKAVELNLPIKGTPYTARDIAITDPDLNCKWCTYCYGVDMDHPGGQAWYDGLIEHIAGLGVDFINYAEAYQDDFEDCRHRVPDLSRLRATINVEPRYNLDRVIAELVEMQNE